MSIVELRINQHDLEEIEDLKTRYENGEVTLNQVKDVINIKILQSILLDAGEDLDIEELNEIYKNIRKPSYSSGRHHALHRLDDIGVYRYDVDKQLLTTEQIEDYLGVDPNPLK